MLEYLKTPTGSYWLTIAIAGTIWFLSGAGIFAGINHYFARIRDANSKAEIAEAQKQKAEDKSRVMESRLETTAAELEAAKGEIKSLKPKPFPDRLKTVLQQIDPRILEALAQGVTDFNGSVNPSDLRSLQELAKEPDAANVLVVSPDIRTLIGGGSEGSIHHVAFFVSPKILENPRSEQGAAHDRE